MADERQLPLFSEAPSPSPVSLVTGDQTPFGKYIVYVDESGDHSLTSIDQNYPVFVVSPRRLTSGKSRGRDAASRT